MQIEQPSQLFAQERHIRQLQQDLNLLSTENEQLKAQLEEITLQKNHLLAIQEQDPIKMILYGIDSFDSRASLLSNQQSLENKINLQQETIINFQREINQLRICMNYKDQEHLKIRKDCQQLKQRQANLIHENNTLRLQVESLKKLKLESVKAIQEGNKKLERFGTEINKIKAQFMEASNINLHELTYIKNSLDQFRNSYLGTASFLENPIESGRIQDSAKIQEFNQKIKVQSQIMEEMGRQLDSRNDEISQLHKNTNSDAKLNPYDTYQHSIQNMIKETINREKNYTDLLKKFQEVSEGLKLSLKEKQSLEDQYARLKESYQKICSMQEENKNLKRQLEKVRQDSLTMRELNTKLLADLQIAVNENDIYLSLITEIYGSDVYTERMLQEKKNYEEREKERSQRNLWANTKELICMNQKLKKKCLKNH